MEIWKDIEGFECDYQVSSYGRVKSLKYGKERIMKLVPDKDNYLQVILSKNRKMKKFLVHRLVGLAFISNPQNLKLINHKDENKMNNNVQNLGWCDAKYNNNYGTGKIRSGLSRRKKVEQYSLKGEFVRSWNSIIEIERNLGINHRNISACCKGKRKSAGNFIWKYSLDV